MKHLQGGVAPLSPLLPEAKIKQWKMKKSDQNLVKNVCVPLKVSYARRTASLLNPKLEDPSEDSGVSSIVLKKA